MDIIYFLPSRSHRLFRHTNFSTLAEKKRKQKNSPNSQKFLPAGCGGGGVAHWQVFTYFTTIGAEIKVEVVYIKTYISDGFIDDGWMNGMHLPHVHGNTHGLCSFVVMFILLERVKEVVWWWWCYTTKATNISKPSWGSRSNVLYLSFPPYNSYRIAAQNIWIATKAYSSSFSFAPCVIISHADAWQRSPTNNNSN